jgi:hypothetical protein
MPDPLRLENMQRLAMTAGQHRVGRGRRQRCKWPLCTHLVHAKFATAKSWLLHRNIFSLIIDDQKPVVPETG